MEITKSQDGTEITLTLDKKLSAVTADELEKKLSEILLPNVKKFTVDMKKLAYVSSAGLRVLLKAQKLMNKQGSMNVTNAVPEVMKIFETTGFDEILNIK